ncbi:hypothetical protein Taro_015672 [Colocasia esculenta]|uniref:CCHC-type domain-containing protein n=1 Tax=Colocasia esculenta TaxID=4460 RepID=A0A843UN04_COLES|nr:hypothetical protein [Colocasia esculenta]
MDYGALMQGLVHAMQTQAQTTAALQAQRPGSAFQLQDRKKKAPAFQQRVVVPARVAAPTPGEDKVAGKTLCTQCGTRHGGKVCWVSSGRCLRCGDKNHKIRDCLKMAQQTAAGAAPAAATPTMRAVLGSRWNIHHRDLKLLQAGELR